jgi:hypothetical protein
MFNEIPENCRYAYARVSSKSQEDNSSLEAQKDEFLRQGVPKKNIRVEVGSAADPIRERPVFYHLIDQELKENDLLFITPIKSFENDVMYVTPVDDSQIDNSNSK